MTFLQPLYFVSIGTFLEALLRTSGLGHDARALLSNQLLKEDLFLKNAAEMGCRSAERLPENYCPIIFEFEGLDRKRLTTSICNLYYHTLLVVDYWLAPILDFCQIYACVIRSF